MKTANNEQKRLIEKIKKLLALSESSNENEALLAATKAKEMLDDLYKFIEKSDHPWQVNYLRTVGRKIEKKKEGKGIWDSSPVVCGEYVNGVIGKNMHRLIHPTAASRSGLLKACLPS